MKFELSFYPMHRWRVASETCPLCHGLVASGAIFFGYTERYTITRLRTKAEADAFFMSSSYHLHIAFICLVPNTGTRLVISVHGINICDGSWKAGHPSHPIPSYGSNPPYPQSSQLRPGALSHGFGAVQTKLCNRHYY